MFSITIGSYGLHCADELPVIYHEYCKHAQLVDEFNIRSNDEDGLCFVAIERDNGWPFLVVTQRYHPAGSGFYPGVALVPETDIAFIGAGTRLLAYQLKSPQRLWEDITDGFWGWKRHGDFIVMSSELEMAVWNIYGEKLWSKFVEPPWNYEVSGNTVRLDVMGTISSFSIGLGPS